MWSLFHFLRLNPDLHVKFISFLRLNPDLHVKFGRIKGMSTRAGNVVLLRDILDKGKNIMVERMSKKRSKTIIGL